MESSGDGSEEEGPIIEDRADPHRHLLILFIVTLVVSAAIALAFR
ncbi:MAG: hypothetical protein ACUVV6_08370 [Thermoplasmatota archaeon]